MPDEHNSLEGQSAEQLQALAAMSDALLKDPNTRADFQRLLKKQNPKLALPEIDTEDRVQAAVAPLMKEIDDLKAGKTVDSAQGAANTMFENLREAGVVGTRKEFGELVKYANEKGFQASSENGLTLAARHREDELRAAEPTPQTAAAQFLRKGDPETKGLMRDPTGWARNKAAEEMDRIIKNRGRAPAHT